jgi:hypothetical protein
MKGNSAEFDFEPFLQPPYGTIVPDLDDDPAAAANFAE